MTAQPLRCPHLQEQVNRRIEESAAVKNFFMWVGVFVSLLFIEGLTPKTEHTMLVLETVSLVVWSLAGVLMAIRGAYRIVTKPRGPKGF